MKKFTLAFTATLLTLAFVATTVFASQAGYTFGATILGGQNTRVGTAQISNDADSVNILFMMRGNLGWCVEEYHIHAEAALEDFPLSGGGNPIPGQFDYSADLGGCLTNVLVEIPLADLAAKGIEPGDQFYLAIHSVVYNQYTGQRETGWTVRCGCLYGQQFDGSNWAGWVVFTPDAWYIP